VDAPHQTFQIQSSKEDREMYRRIANRLGVDPSHVRAVALGKQTSAKVASALTEERLTSRANSHVRQQNTPAALAVNRAKKTRELLTERGIPPELAAVGLKAAMESLQRCIPDSKAEAMTQRELFEKAGIITNTTGQRALKELLSACEIQRIGNGVVGDPYRYFRS